MLRWTAVLAALAAMTATGGAHAQTPGSSADQGHAREPYLGVLPPVNRAPDRGAAPDARTEPGPGDPITLFASGFEVPFGIAFDGNGDLFVAELYGHRVSRVTPDGESSVFVTGIQYPYDLAFDGFGELLVTSANGLVYKVSSEGVAAAFLTDVAYPIAVTTGPDGSIWVSDLGGLGVRFLTDVANPLAIKTGPDPGGYSLRRYDAFGEFQESIDVSHIGYALDLAFSPEGELYFSVPYGGIYEIEEGRPEVFVQMEQAVAGLAYDVDGFLYVADAYENKVMLLDPEGALVNDPFAITNLAGPYNLAFGRDSDGTTNARLFAANYGSTDPPEFSEAIVEMNRAGIRAPGWPVAVELLVIANDSLRDGVMGAEYADALRITDESVEPSWSVIAGALPPGINVASATGVLSGVPEESGTFSFRVRVEAGSQFGERDYSITVSAPTLALADVADQLLGVADALTEDEERFLDLIGNRNGGFDVGDLRAFVLARRAQESAANLAGVVLTERERAGKNGKP